MGDVQQQSSVQRLRADSFNAKASSSDRPLGPDGSSSSKRGSTAGGDPDEVKRPCATAPAQNNGHGHTNYSRCSTGNLFENGRQSVSLRSKKIAVYSTGLTEAVEGRMRLLKRAHSGEASKYTATLTPDQLREPDRLLAAAELFSMITKQFNLPALSEEAKDYAIAHLVRTTVKAGEVLIAQGSPGDRMYMLTEGRVSFSRNGGPGRVCQGPMLFGELSVIYNTERTAECAIPPGQDATVYYFTKTSWAEFMSLEVRQSSSPGGQSSGQSSSIGSAAPPANHAMSEPLSPKFRPMDELPPRLKFNELQPLSLLGEGGFSSVTLVRSKLGDGTHYAMKTMDKSSVVKNNLAKKVVTEKKLLRSVAKSPFCIKLVCTYMDADFLYFLMEVAESGDLMEYMIDLQVLPYYHARFYIACIALAIGHCHAHCIVHRDVKPENCLVCGDGRVKLADFGLSKQLPCQVDMGDGTTSICSLAFTMCGTPEFLAPEFIFSRGYDRRVDWWAFGCVLYEMLFSQSPFVTNDLKTTFTRICDAANGTYPRSVTNDLSQTYDAAAKFILGLICSQSARLCASGNLKEILHHDYFADFSWDDFTSGKMPVPPKPTSKLKQHIDHGEVVDTFFSGEYDKFTGRDDAFADFLDDDDDDNNNNNVKQ